MKGAQVNAVRKSKWPGDLSVLVAWLEKKMTVGELGMRAEGVRVCVCGEGWGRSAGSGAEKQG